MEATSSQSSSQGSAQESQYSTPEASSVLSSCTQSAHAAYDRTEHSNKRWELSKNTREKQDRKSRIEALSDEDLTDEALAK